MCIFIKIKAKNNVCPKFDNIFLHTVQMNLEKKIPKKYQFQGNPQLGPP